MRPTALIPCLLAPALLAACGGPAPPASPPPTPPPACELRGNFQQTVYTVIGRDRALSNTSYGLLLADRKSGATLCAESVGGDQEVYPASAIKTLIAVTLFRLIDRGAVSLQDIVSISQPNAADECSRWECSLYGPGKRVSVKTLVSDMITVSNKIATNQLIDVVSKDECNRTADLLGARSLRIIPASHHQPDHGRVVQDQDGTVRTAIPSPRFTEQARNRRSGHRRVQPALELGLILAAEHRLPLLLGGQHVFGWPAPTTRLRPYPMVQLSERKVLARFPSRR